MIKNYFLLFVRNLRRQRLFSTINLLGLTVSITSTLLIYIYVSNEFSYDNFHPHAERIYRVNQTFIWSENNNNQFARTGPGVAVALKDEVPEIELMTSIHTPGDFIISYTNDAKEVLAFEEKRVFAADSNFFRMFNFPMVKGDPASALRHANTLVMTESTAKKYFHDVDPVGKLVRLSGPADKEQKTFEVTGVVKDLPENSGINFEVLLSLKSYPIIERLHWSWVWTQLETFVRLTPNADMAKVKARLAGIPKKYAGETLRVAMNTTWDEYVRSGKKWELFLEPLMSIHLPTEQIAGNWLVDIGDRQVIYSFIGAAIFIVLLSCVNFMNLSTAQFTRRIKEASIRKILGLGKKELGISYFFEAMAFCLIALVAALGLAQIFIPGFNLVTGKQLQMHLFDDPKLITALLALVLFMAALSSSYPALFLTTFNPVEAIKGKAKVGHEGKFFRSGLVVFQFVVSIVLMICTGVVFQQLNYVSEKDLGFDKENLIVIPHLESAPSPESLVKAARQMPVAVQATWCSSVPPTVFGGDTFTAEGASDKKFPLNFTNGDEQYIPTLGIKLKLGRNFSENNPGDVNRIIINETAVKRIGWELNESVIGKKIEYDGVRYEVVGVTEDFNYWSIQDPIEPMAIFHMKSGMRDGGRQLLVMKVKPQSSSEWQQTFADLRELWKQHAGDMPFQYSFVDQTFEETFRTQQQFGKILSVLAGLAIVIASLGLLGMIIYALEQRTKEIGIRKVSGASVIDILTLISKSYTWLIAIAFLIGAPFSYWLMSKWLEAFSYRIAPSVWIFIASGVSTLTLAIVITGYHSIKAALMNPVEVLRDE